MRDYAASGSKTAVLVKGGDSPAYGQVASPRQMPPAQSISSPLDSALGRISNTSSSSAHASLLNQVKTSQPSLTQRSLLKLQQQYGNQCVQRVLNISRRSDDDLGDRKLASSVKVSHLQRKDGIQRIPVEE